MIKKLLLLFILLIIYNGFSQNPYIKTNSGIGQYGYLEKDASTTMLLNSDSHGNIYQLFGRTWINGTNKLTYGTAVNSCSGNNIDQTTNNYNFGLDAIPGQIAYTSVHADYCGGSNSYGGNPNQTGFNERQHFIFDVSDRPSDLSSSIIQTNPTFNYNGNVVMSVNIDFGTNASRYLQRFWIQNTGTLAENSEIANDGFVIYYEPVTGTELFDGNESSAILYGDYNGNSTSNNIFGHDLLNINIPSGGLRIYVVLRKFSGCITSSKTVQVSLINDGLNFTPNMDTSFSLSRIGQTPSTPASINVEPATSVSGALSGNYYIPSSCFPTVVSAVSTLNSNGVSGPVVFNILSGYSETTPTGGFALLGAGTAGNLATGTATNTITFQKYGTGLNPTFTAPIQSTSGSTYSDAIFKIIGGDYITIDGLTLQERTTGSFTYTSATNNVTEFGVALFYASTTNGAQNCTIRNCTIDMDINGPNGFGIYSNTTHSSTSPTASAPSTSAAGSNSNLTITGNIITDVNFPIAVVGATTNIAYNDNLTIGGSIANANTITNFGRVTPTNSFNLVSGTINGILVRNTKNFTISYNNIDNTVIATAPTLSTIRAVFVDTFSATPSGTNNINISNNKISLKANGASADGINIDANTGVATSVAINNNEFSNFTVTGAGSVNLLRTRLNATNSEINNNEFQNLNLTTTGGVAFITNSTTALSGGSKTVNNNRIVTGFTKSGAGGTVYIYRDENGSGASSVTGATITNTGNNFSNITLTAASTTILGWINTDFSNASSMPTKNISNNTFENWSVTSVANLSVMDLNGFGGTTSSISNNTIRNISKSSTFTLNGINIGNRGVATTLNVSDNIIENLTSATGTLYGIVDVNPSSTTNIISNQIQALTSSATTVNAIRHQTAVNIVNINDNTIDNITSNSVTVLSELRAISQTAAATVTIDDNTISNINFNTASSGNVTAVIQCSNAAVATVPSIKGNSISNVTHASTVNTSQVIGINALGSQNYDISDNTIYNIIGNGSITSSNTGSSVIGISSTSSGVSQKINNNLIYGLRNNNASNNNNSIVGIATNSTTAGGEIYNNRIYGFENVSTGVSPFIAAFMPLGGNWTYANNMVSLSNGSNTNGMQCVGAFDNGSAGTRNYYYNTFYIGGNSTGTQNSIALQYNSGLGTANIINNILNNARTGSGKNYAIANTAATIANFNSNYNVLNGINTQAIAATNGITDRTFLAWQGLGYDINSLTNTTLSFVDIATADLHINNICELNSKGTPVAITSDYDGQTRNATTPDIGADEKDVEIAEYNGSWVGGIEPNASRSILFNANYNSSADIVGCNCAVQSGNIVINNNLILTKELTVSGGSLTFENNASLIQTKASTIDNSGSITYKRSTRGLKHLDFVYWGSMVENQTILGIWMSNASENFYRFNSATGTQGSWVGVPGSHIMQEGIGYIARARYNSNGWAVYTLNPPGGVIWDASFIGKPRSGNVNLSLTAERHHLLGNPYPSAIDFDVFALQEQSTYATSPFIPTIYYWTQTTPISNNQYAQNDYAVYNAVLQTGTTVDTFTATKNIAAGQGFFVKTKVGATAATFKNTQRVTGNNTNFTRQADANIVLDRYWLNLNNTSTTDTKQIAVVHIAGATNGYDVDYDSTTLSGNTSMNFYSVVGTYNLVIQGLAPMQITDVIPLGFNAITAGSYSINLANFEGIFTTQNIFLQDTQTNTIHNIKTAPYNFVTTAGTFNSRFNIIYQNTTLSNPVFTNESQVVITSNDKVTIYSAHENIATIEVFDLLGRKVFNSKEGTQKTVVLDKLKPTNSALIVKVTLANGTQKTNKIIY